MELHTYSWVFVKVVRLINCTEAAITFTVCHLVEWASSLYSM